MITDEYRKFFAELELNNSTAWFHTNKKRYEEHAKNPFLELVGRLIPHVQEMEPKVSENPKDALFRINRDIRFSKDKSPYNTIMKAGFSANGKKSELPGFYLGIDADNIHVGGGLFMVKAPALKAVRILIKEETEEFNSIVNSSSFTKMFGALKGEQAKRLDKSLTSTLETTPYIANKQFYAMAKLDIEPYFENPELEKVIVKHFKEINRLNQFLNKAVS